MQVGPNETAIVGPNQVAKSSSRGNWKTTWHAVALNYFAYKFIRIHRTLRMSLAMAVGVETRQLESRRFGCPLGIFRATEGGKSGANGAMGISSRSARNYSE